MGSNNCRTRGRANLRSNNRTLAPRSAAFNSSNLGVQIGDRAADCGLLRSSLCLLAPRHRIVQAVAANALLFPAFPAFALLAAVSFDRLAELDFPSFSLARFARLSVVLVLGLTLFAQALEWVNANPLAFIAGYESRADYLTRRLAPQGYYTVLQNLNRLPSDARVYFLWEPRSYYAPDVAKVSPDALLDHFGDLQFRYGNADAMAQALTMAGYNYVLLNRAGLNYYLTTQYDPIPSSEIALLQELLARHAEIVAGRDAVQLDPSGGLPFADTDTYALYKLLPTKQ